MEPFHVLSTYISIFIILVEFLTAINYCCNFEEIKIILVHSLRKNIFLFLSLDRIKKHLNCKYSNRLLSYILLQKDLLYIILPRLDLFFSINLFIGAAWQTNH